MQAKAAIARVRVLEEALRAIATDEYMPARTKDGVEVDAPVFTERDRIRIARTALGGEQ